MFTDPHQPSVTAFFDETTSTLSYVVADVESKVCAIIDPVLELEESSAEITTRGAEQMLEYLRINELSCEYILETHAHADHLSAAYFLKHRLSAPIGIGQSIIDVQHVFADMYSETPSFKRDGSQFDVLLADGQQLALGRFSIEALHVPGHTPACMAYRVGNTIFVGDTLFMPDSGTARCDFPGGSAAALYHSIRRLLELPSETRVFVCHDYQPNGRELAYETTVEAHKRENIHVKDGINESEFVSMRTARDSQLSTPRLMLPSMQVNIRAGALPVHPVSARPVITMPLNAFSDVDVTELTEKTNA
jgi:glyoxylase-like metal-dependent hydrolase (beta-lactamase superfamily II)